jgi:hypothetical protein
MIRHIETNLEKEKQILYPSPLFLILGLLAHFSTSACSPSFLPFPPLFPAWAGPNWSLATVAASLSLCR